MTDRHKRFLPWWPVTLLRWWEPVRFQRRAIGREFHRFRWLFVRALVYGLALAALLHGLMNGLNVPMPMPLTRYYAGAVFIVPGMLVLTLALHALFPRCVTMSARGVSIQSGQSVMFVPGERIQDWRLRQLRRASRMAIVRLRYQSRDGRSRTRSFGLSPGLNVLQLDRALCIVRRMGLQHAPSKSTRVPCGIALRG